jgi:hypothetical protein
LELKAKPCHHFLGAVATAQALVAFNEGNRVLPAKLGLKAKK